MSRQFHIALIVPLLFLLACSYKAPSTSSASPSPGNVSTSGLVQSQYPTCNQQGETLAKYLDSGEPKSNDPAYGNERQQVLALQGDQRALAIRQYADQYISQCAQQESQAEAAAAQAKADAEQKAQAEAQKQKHDQNAQANCARVGGTWKTGGIFGPGCNIDYVSKGDGQTYHYGLSFDQDGNIVSDNLPEDKGPDACAAYGRQLGDQTVWHSDTMICSI